MKSNTLIAAALLGLGLISSAHASGTFGTTNICYITGSTAFRNAVFNGVTNTAAGVFDPGTTITLQPTTATGGTGNYNAFGKIHGTPYVLSFSFTGSEAGLAALEGTTITYIVPKHALPTSPASGIATVAGTPKPSTFVDPATGSANVTAAPDLAFSDTSQAVSLSSTKSALFDNGIVAVIPFEWVKGNMSTPSASWTHLVNVTHPQLVSALGGTIVASYLTGTNSDTDTVYMIGRNEGSGTRVNTLLDTFYGVTIPVAQWCPTNSSYVNGVLTVGTAGNIVSQGGLAFIANEGFESGSGIAATLKYDSTGWGITLGYLGVSDANSAISGGGSKLTLDGVPENDETVIEGTYTYWGHEHLYGVPTQTSSTVGGIVADAMTGVYTVNAGTGNSGLGGSSTAAGGLETQFSNPATGGNEVNPAGTQSLSLDPAKMAADKPGDSGYPTQL